MTSDVLFSESVFMFINGHTVHLILHLMFCNVLIFCMISSENTILKSNVSYLSFHCASAV